MRLKSRAPETRKAPFWSPQRARDLWARMMPPHFRQKWGHKMGSGEHSACLSTQMICARFGICVSMAVKVWKDAIDPRCAEAGEAAANDSLWRSPTTRQNWHLPPCRMDTAV